MSVKYPTTARYKTKELTGSSTTVSGDTDVLEETSGSDNS
jgi:hypothetical protein